MNHIQIIMLTAVVSFIALVVIGVLAETVLDNIRERKWEARIRAYYERAETREVEVDGVKYQIKVNQ